MFRLRNVLGLRRPNGDDIHNTPYACNEPALHVPSFSTVTWLYRCFSCFLSCLVPATERECLHPQYTAVYSPIPTTYRPFLLATHIKPPQSRGWRPSQGAGSDRKQVGTLSRGMPGAVRLGSPQPPSRHATSRVLHTSFTIQHGETIARGNLVFRSCMHLSHSIIRILTSTLTTCATNCCFSMRLSKGQITMPLTGSRRILYRYETNQADYMTT